MSQFLLKHMRIFKFESNWIHRYTVGPESVSIKSFLMPVDNNKQQLDEAYETINKNSNEIVNIHVLEKLPFNRTMNRYCSAMAQNDKQLN